MGFEAPRSKPESVRQPEKRESPAIDRVITANGSVYKYLPDGRIQRFKKAEGKLYEPQNMLVFVPDFDWVQKNAPAKVKALFGDSPAQYEQTMLEYVQGKGKKNFIVDASGKKLETNEEIAAASGPVFLTFGEGEKIDFFIPVTIKPRLGWYTFDARKYKEGGEYKREVHLGNKVVEVINR